MDIAEALNSGKFVAHDGPIDEQAWDRVVTALPGAVAVGVRLRGQQPSTEPKGCVWVSGGKREAGRP